VDVFSSRMGKKGANGKPKYSQRQKQRQASYVGKGITKKDGLKVSGATASSLRKDKQFEVCFDDEEGYQPQEKQTKVDRPNADNKLTLMLHTPNSTPREAGVFTEQQRILLVGEGDFSFAMALASRRGSRNLVATSYDSLHTVKEKYPNSVATVRTLREAGVEVFGGIDCTRLGVDGAHAEVVAPEGKKLLWDRIAFNFPHVGGGTEADVDCNQKLLSAFFEACKPLLHPARGHAVVTLRNTSFYRGWNINKLAQEAGLHLHDTRPFDTDMFATYTPVRTNPAVREAPTADDGICHSYGCHRKKRDKTKDRSHDDDDGKGKEGKGAKRDKEKERAKKKRDNADDEC